MGTKPSLTQEELDELAALEAEEASAKDEAVLARKRQHLAALRLAKKLSALHGKRGVDFEVVQTTAGNFAIRRPVDLEIDSLDHEAEGSEGRAKAADFLCSIALEPKDLEMKAALTNFPALSIILQNVALALCGRRLEEEGK